MKRWLFFLLILFPFFACAQTPEKEVYVTTPADRALSEQVITDLKAHGDESPGAMMVRAAKALLGQPYVAGTLEELSDEKLCIYLTRTDCILFVETCLGLVRTARQGGDFETFAQELRESRYRDGVCNRYEDRLHYTTEWARQGVSRGALEDWTERLGGIPLDHPVHYMSQHPEAYPRVSDLEAIRAAEERINALPSAYIPKPKLSEALKGVRSGDILFYTTSIDGLDISHCAIAVVEKGTVRFIHASTGPMKVVMDPRPVAEYLSGRKSATGLQVYRVR